MKCRYCGEKVECEEHGTEAIVEEVDLAGYPFYYCAKCVEQYQTAFGAIVHIHTEEAVSDIYNELCKILKGGERDPL